VLSIADDTGITLAQALQTFGCDPSVIGTLGRPAGRTIGYLEAHIEQGPVLEAEGLPVGVVTAIAGATRTLVHVKGVAGHAGTVPMTGRRDALAGAAECVLAVERCCTGRDDVVGTVGKFQARPGAVNVIAGEVTFSIDVRAPDDDERDEALRNIEAAISVHCGRRHLSVHMEEIYREPATPMDEGLTEVLAGAIADLGLPVRRLPSGAGHDAMAMAALCPTAMLFVRCEKGISHNPAENVTADDVGTAAAVMLRFLERLAERPSPS
jgi:allantoate deiminase